MLEGGAEDVRLVGRALPVVWPVVPFQTVYQRPCRIANACKTL
jgi:hypothetical protein